MKRNCYQILAFQIVKSKKKESVRMKRVNQSLKALLK